MQEVNATMSAISEFARTVQDLRIDMKRLIEVLTNLNESLVNLDKATATIDKLQKTMEANQSNLTHLVEEMSETNKNINTLLDVIKTLKEE
jgi:chromosome segregation ATPase